LKINALRFTIEGYIKVPCEEWYINFDKMLIKWGPYNDLVTSEIRYKGGPLSRIWEYENYKDGKWYDFGPTEMDDSDHSCLIDSMYEAWLGNGNKKTSSNT
jgi:hypothetical protein